MPKGNLSVDRLLASGFEEVGCWELNDARDLSHRIELPQRAGVYAFATDGIVQYVGLAAKSLKQRLGFYRKPSPSQRTNIRLNEIIRGHVEKGAVVQILIVHPPDFEWNGFRISGPEGLEAGLIAQFDLLWNMRGSGSTAGKPAENPMPQSQENGFYVYENWTVDKALIHRAGCSFCRGGAGLHGTGRTKNSAWHGPFDSSAAAMAKAKASGRSRIEGCSVCSPV